MADQLWRPDTDHVVNEAEAAVAELSAGDPGALVAAFAQGFECGVRQLLASHPFDVGVDVAALTDTLNAIVERHAEPEQGS